jgi:hypothetical protein
VCLYTVSPSVGTGNSPQKEREGEIDEVKSKGGNQEQRELQQTRRRRRRLSLKKTTAHPKRNASSSEQPTKPNPTLLFLRSFAGWAVNYLNANQITS